MLTSIALLLILAAGPPTSPEQDCTGIGTWTATCDVLNNGDSIDLSGHLSLPPSTGLGGTPNVESTPPRDCGALNRCDDFTVSLLPQATISDVTSFAPQPAALSSQPAGFGVAGIPMAFSVAAAQHSATGTLFDLPVTVRFTPDDISIAPGDGTTITVGGTAPTPASHTYRSRGGYVATATVSYRAEVDFGRGWRPVAGILDIPTAGYPVEVLEARSTLVDRTCAEPPAGPGC